MNEIKQNAIQQAHHNPEMKAALRQYSLTLNAHLSRCNNQLVLLGYQMEDRVSQLQAALLQELPEQLHQGWLQSAIQSQIAVDAYMNVWQQQHAILTQSKQQCQQKLLEIEVEQVDDISNQQKQAWLEELKLQQQYQQQQEFSEEQKHQIDIKNQQAWLEERKKTQKYKQQYRLEHKEEIAQYQQQYYQQHKEEIAQYQQQYRLEHKEEIAQYQQQYRLEHKEEIAQYQQHKEEIAQYQQQYRQQAAQLRLALKRKLASRDESNANRCPDPSCNHHCQHDGCTVPASMCHIHHNNAKLKQNNFASLRSQPAIDAEVARNTVDDAILLTVLCPYHHLLRHHPNPNSDPNSTQELINSIKREWRFCTHADCPRPEFVCEDGTESAFACDHLVALTDKHSLPPNSPYLKLDNVSSLAIKNRQQEAHAEIYKCRLMHRECHDEHTITQRYYPDLDWLTAEGREALIEQCPHLLPILDAVTAYQSQFP